MDVKTVFGGLVQDVQFSFTHWTLGCFIFDAIIVGWILTVIGLVAHSIYVKRKARLAKDSKRNFTKRVVNHRKIV